MSTGTADGAAARRPTTVGVPRETAPGERRVALVPVVVGKLRARGVEVVVEPGAGLGALIPDEQYTAAGAVLGDPWSADAVLTVTPPTHERDRAACAGGGAHRLPRPAHVAGDDRGAARGGCARLRDGVGAPHLARAEHGRAVVAGERGRATAPCCSPPTHLTRYFPMLTTAAGTVRPATALVLGVGVAGLQALATAKRLGARTTGYDVRPEVADQVRSLGAQWLDLGIEATGPGRLRAGADRGRADRAAEAPRGGDHRLRRGDHDGERARRRAPTLVTAEAVAGMRPGSVVVDLAGESGGNCALTTPGETVVHHDVTVAAPLNLAASMPEHASELYARNVVALLELMLDEHGVLDPATDDEVLFGACVTRPVTGRRSGGRGCWRTSRSWSWPGSSGSR